MYFYTHGLYMCKVIYRIKTRTKRKLVLFKWLLFINGDTFKYIFTLRNLPAL